MDSKDAGLVADTLTHVLNKTEALEIQDCEEALAAAEVVSALTGNASEDFPEDPLDQLDALSLTATPALKEVAVGAVKRIIEASELKAHWDENGQLQDWIMIQEDLIKRIS